MNNLEYIRKKRREWLLAGLTCKGLPRQYAMSRRMEKKIKRLRRRVREPELSPLEAEWRKFKGEQ